ncbi:hypothetical protein D3C79_771670 [compost metagenome]
MGRPLPAIQPLRLRRSPHWRVAWLAHSLFGDRRLLACCHGNRRPAPRGGFSRTECRPRRRRLRARPLSAQPANAFCAKVRHGPGADPRPGRIHQLQLREPGVRPVFRPPGRSRTLRLRMQSPAPGCKKLRAGHRCNRECPATAQQRVVAGGGDREQGRAGRRVFHGASEH